MSKEVINVGGEEKVVREDTAKSYRGTIWALGSVAIFIIVVLLVLFVFLGKTMTDDKPGQTPGAIGNNAR